MRTVEGDRPGPRRYAAASGVHRWYSEPGESRPAFRQRVVAEATKLNLDMVTFFQIESF